MEQKTQFSYDEFWKLYESNERPDRPIIDSDGWTDTVELEVRAPPWVRISSRRDPFPPCAELARWPANYPVGDLADLTEEEAAEEDPNRFVFSDGEMEAWAMIVATELDKLGRPQLAGCASSRTGEEEAAPERTQEVNTMEEKNDTKTNSKGPVKKFQAGGVKVAVWANQGPKGGTFHSATLERNFRRADGSWDATTSYRANDIPRAIAVLQKAYEFMVLSKHEDRPSSHDDVKPGDCSERVPAAAPVEPAPGAAG